MPRLSRFATGNNESLYLFSHDLVWGCRHYALEARKSQHDYLTFTANLSCILFGGSFIEARLNELSADMVATREVPRAPAAFWTAFHTLRKDLAINDKWNLIASVSGGKAWDSSSEPFQSYDLILSLRNALVHYKGEYATSSEPPVKKIHALLERFSGPGFTFNVGCQPEWITQLLTSKALGDWISQTVDDFDMKFNHYLTGKEFTDLDRDAYTLLNDTRHDPFPGHRDYRR